MDADERANISTTAEALLLNTIIAGDIDSLYAVLPEKLTECAWKKVSIAQRFHVRRKQIMNWLGSTNKWERDLVTKRPDGCWKVRYRFYRPGAESSPKRKFKTLYFAFRYVDDKWCLMYVGGWDAEKGEKGFWP